MIKNKNGTIDVLFSYKSKIEERPICWFDNVFDIVNLNNINEILCSSNYTTGRTELIIKSYKVDYVFMVNDDEKWYLSEQINYI